MKRIIKLNEQQFKNIINNSVSKIINSINEERNKAYNRSSATEGMKKIWDIIDKKQKKLYDMVFGDLGDKLDELTMEKAKLMGEEYLNIPEVICGAGNDKLPENVLIVNMSSSLMCPSFYLGLCQIKGGACYAQRAENQYTNNVLPQRFKTDLMHTQMLRQYQNGNKNPMKEYFRIVELYIHLANKYATDECNNVIKFLEKKMGRKLSNEERNIISIEHSKNKITDVRLNETGDFHCQLAVDLWSKFAKKIKQKYGINTHAYTARNLDFSEASKNININYSHKGEYDSEYQKPRYYMALTDGQYNKLENVPVDENSQPVLGPKYKGKYYYKCPCTASETKCDMCGVCFNKNKTGEEYIIYTTIHGNKNAQGLVNGFTIPQMKPVVNQLHDIGWTNEKEKGKEENENLKNYSKNVEIKQNANKKKLNKNNTKKKKGDS